MRCARDFPAPKLTPAEDAQIRADLMRDIGRRLAELEAARGGEGRE